MLNVALIDKNPHTRQKLNYLLNKCFKGAQLLEAESTTAFHQSYPGMNPAIFILGFSSATSSSNLKSIRQISSCNYKGKIMVIDQDPVLIASYLRENVKGYLSKKSCNSELVACINLVLSGKKYISFDMIEKLMKRGNKTVHSNKRPKLTFKQYEIAKYLAKGISIEVIAKKLGKNPASIIASKAHIYNVLKVSDPINLNTLISTVSLTR